MKTCDGCGREFTGRGKGRLCAFCNNHTNRLSRGDGRNNSAELMGILDDAENLLRSEEEGWWYDDDDPHNPGYPK